jgi:hypothetical protein
MYHSQMLAALHKEAMILLPEKTDELPVAVSISKCKEAVDSVIAFHSVIQGWSVALPIQVPEKVDVLRDLFEALVKASLDASEYMDRMKAFIGEGKLLDADKKKKWRNARSSFATSLHQRQVPPCMCKVGSFAQQHVAVACEDVGLDSILIEKRTESFDGIPEKTADTEYPLFFPGLLGGAWGEEMAKMVKTDLEVITAKGLDLFAHCITNNYVDAMSTSEATVMPQYPTGDKAYMNVVNTEYKKHVVQALEI